MAAEEELIRFFDEQMSRQTPIEILVARTAEFVGRPVGATDQAGDALRAHPGSPCETRDAPAEAATRRLRSGERVWVEHSGEASEVAVLLDLFSVAAKAALALAGGACDDRRLRAALFSGDDTERLTALKALGMASTNPIIVFGVAGPHSGRRRVTEQVRSSAMAVYTVPVGSALVVLAREPRSLNRLIREEGLEMLRTLDIVVASASLRNAARRLPTHHSSVAHRVERAARALGFRMDEPYGRNRLFLALLLRRLRDTAHLL